jgi:hypothetical protein
MADGEDHLHKCVRTSLLDVPKMATIYESGAAAVTRYRAEQKREHCE